MYVFHLIDSYAAGTSILFLGIAEVIIIGWMYGKAIEVQIEMKRVDRTAFFACFSKKLQPNWLINHHLWLWLRIGSLMKNGYILSLDCLL